MDPRILQKINKIKQKENSEKENKRRQEEEYEKRRQKEIVERMSEAREYVTKYLFDKIAKASVEGKKEIRLEWYRGDLAYIPVESIAKAASEIDGLKIREEWFPEWTGHFNSDEVEETIPAHYEYYVTWSK